LKIENSQLPIFNLALAGIERLVISTEARDAILRTRPELAGDFETFGDQSRIPITSLLRPAPSRYVPSTGFRDSGSANPEPGNRNSEPILGLGDLLAALLHYLRIDAAVALIVRRGLLRGCQCAARQARLNALTPRLGRLLEPWPLTLTVILAWLLFVVALLAR